MAVTVQAAIQEFKTTVYRERCLRALLFTVLFHLGAFLLVLPALCAVNSIVWKTPLLHPTWLYVLVVVGLTCALGFIHAAWFTVRPRPFTGWLQHLLPLTNLHVFGTVISHLLITTLLTRSYLGLLGTSAVSDLFTACSDRPDAVCINEWHLFLVCHASFNGLVMALSYFLDNRDLVSFPVIQQRVSERVRHALDGCVREAVWQNARALRWFYLLYWLRGGWLCHVIASSLDVPREGVASDSLLGLLSARLLLNALLLGSLSWFVFLLGLSLFQIWHTETLQLKMQSLVEASEPLVLTAALEAADCPLLQHLAFLEFSESTRLSAAGRAPAFQLSQPGGHPYTWNALAGSSLQQVRQLTGQLEAALSSDAAPAAPENNNKGPEPAVFGGMRKLAGPSGAPAARQPARPLLDTAALLAALRRRLQSRPVIGQLLAEPPDAALQKALAGGQLAVWAVDGLTNLAVASYTEDQYGAAQQHLAQLLTALLRLAQLLERARRARLRQTVTTALFRLTETFGKHLRHMNLSGETLGKLERYSSYTEG